MARETAPDMDERDGGLDVIRERLDGSPLTDWRAPLARWVERAGVWLGAEAPPAPSGDSQGVAASGRRLTVRQKLMRGMVITLVVALALFTLLGGPSAAMSALGSLHAALFPAPPALTITASDYALEQLPQPAQHLPRIALAPEVTRPGAAFACWINFPQFQPTDQRGQVMGYRTADFAQTWARLNLPAIDAVDCGVVTDRAGGDGALIIVTPGVTSIGFCQAPRLLRTMDGGATWLPAAWAHPTHPASLAPCDTQFALDGDAIFAWSARPLLTGAPPTNESGRLIVTRDNGATWTVADRGLRDDAGLALVGFRSGGRILAETWDVSGPLGAAKLVESSDYGATWRDVGDVPGAFPTVYASTDPNVANGGGWGRLYAIARPLDSGAPDSASRVLLATAATIGSGWTPIPLPPLATTDDSSAESARPVVIGVGPGESLLVERGIVPTNYETQLSPSRRLWAWSVNLGRWLPDPQTTLGNANLQGWGWSHGHQVVWITSLQLGVPPTLLLFTKTYMAARLGPAS